VSPPLRATRSAAHLSKRPTAKKKPK
jgi:hypothetical protein